MKPLQVIGVMVLMAGCARAELTVIGIKVARTANEKIVVSVFDGTNSRHDLSVADAAALLQKEKGAGSVVLVGIVAERVLLSDYMPLLETIARNHVLRLSFIECGTHEGINDNIRRLIDPEWSSKNRKGSR